jgi:hypothetical protein
MRLLPFLTVFLAAKCRDCYPSREPELKAIFYQDSLETDISFQKVYGLGGKNTIHKKNGYYYLPISLHADSVTYIFESGILTDTVTFYYSRTFAFHSERCGYEAKFYEDKIATTFSTASFSFLSDRKYVYEAYIYL